MFEPCWGMKMPERDLVDNDIVFKVCCFGFRVEFQQTFDGNPAPHRLGLATYVLPKKIARSSRVRDKASAQAQLGEFLAWSVGLEPTDDEIELAAKFETIAQQQNIDLDSGESLLSAVLLTRGAQRLFTGDKRAIIGLGAMIEQFKRKHEIAGKIVCFEQVVTTLLRLLGVETLIDRICREPDVDKTAAICCGCASGGDSEEARISEGLQSYINHLRESCGNILTT